MNAHAYAAPCPQVPVTLLLDLLTGYSNELGLLTVLRVLLKKHHACHLRMGCFSHSGVRGRQHYHHVYS